MELSIYSLFKVNIENLVANKAVICKHFYMQPSEIDRMPYWEYEMTHKECEKMAEEEKKQQEEQSAGYQQPDYQRNANAMMKNLPKPAMPSMPRMPKI